MFYVGQEVECVNDTNSCGLLKRGSHYIVERVHPPFLTLAGVRGNPLHGMLATRFRPLVKRKTEISIFTEILNKTPETVP